MTVRGYLPADQAGVDGLLDPGADSLLWHQAHRLHGPDRDGDRWRRTVVAVRDDRVVAVATRAANPVHAGRDAVVVEVAADQRRHGLGTRLFHIVRMLRDRPMSAKVWADDRAARGFAASVGGRVYATCLAARIDPTSTAVAAWVRSRDQVPGVRVHDLTSVEDTVIRAEFGRVYEWVHAGWSPVSSVDALTEVVAAVPDELDRAASVFAVRDRRVAAAVFVFPDPDGVSVVAETTDRTEPDGERVLATAVAAALTHLADAGVRDIGFDGHTADPHLAPVVAGIPATAGRTLLLVEFD